MGSFHMYCEHFANLRTPGLRSDRGGTAILSWLPRRSGRLPSFVSLVTRRHVVYEETGEKGKNPEPATSGL